MAIGASRREIKLARENSAKKRGGAKSENRKARGSVGSLYRGIAKMSARLAARRMKMRASSRALFAAHARHNGA